MHPAAQHIPGAVKALEPVISQYGYFAVFGLLLLEDFGLPVPGETVLIAAAFYAGLGKLNIVLVAIIAFAGAVAGDNIGFAIGYFGGHPLVERYGRYIFLTKARIDKAEAFFRRHGGKVVTIARFIDGLRQANGIIAGLSEMHWFKFLIFNVLGAAIWVTTWSLVGYLGGNHIQAFLRYELYFTLTVFAVFIAMFLRRRLRRNHTEVEESE